MREVHGNARGGCDEREDRREQGPDDAAACLEEHVQQRRGDEPAKRQEQVAGPDRGGQQVDRHDQQCRTEHALLAARGPQPDKGGSGRPA